MDRQHVDARGRCGLDCVTDRVRYIVVFEIQKYFGSRGTHFLNYLRSRRSEKLIADLEKADGSSDCFEEFAGGLRRRNIQWNDYFILCSGRTLHGLTMHEDLESSKDQSNPGDSRRAADGFHELATWMLPVGLYDSIEIEPASFAILPIERAGARRGSFELGQPGCRPL